MYVINMLQLLKNGKQCALGYITSGVLPRHLRDLESNIYEYRLKQNIQPVNMGYYNYGATSTSTQYDIKIEINYSR